MRLLRGVHPEPHLRFFAESTLSYVRFFTEFILSEILRSLRFLRMTGNEGLRTTVGEGLRTTVGEGLAMTWKQA